MIANQTIFIIVIVCLLVFALHYVIFKLVCNKCFNSEECPSLNVEETTIREKVMAAAADDIIDEVHETTSFIDTFNMVPLSKFAIKYHLNCRNLSRKGCQTSIQVSFL